MQQKVYNNPISFIGILSIFVLSTILTLGLFKVAHSQQNSFIELKDGQFMLDDIEFFPLSVSYSVRVVQDINGDFFIAPSSGYGSNWAQCGKNNSGFYCGTTISEWKYYIRKHLDKIADMGFNSVRMVGLEIKHNPDMTGSNTLASNRYNIQDNPDNLTCFKSHKGYKICRKTINQYVDLIEEFVKIVRERNEEVPDKQLRIMITTGNGGLQNYSWLYTKYLKAIGKRFRNDPTIYAYELNFEPYYLGSPKYEIDQKYACAENFAQWYYALKEVAPSQLITFGALFKDVLNWDAQTFPVDFINFHHYPSTKRPYDSHEADRYKSILKWFSEAYDKPWIIGEIGLAGNDVAHEQNQLISTEDQQREFAETTLAYSRWYGAIGYSWWQYKEVPWRDVTNPKAHSNYYGLVRMKDKADRHKVAANAFIDFDPFIKCYTCFDPDPEIYYNPNGYQFLNITGHITTPQGDPVKNAYIIGKSKQESYYTFSDENGAFQIYTKPKDHVFELIATFPGMNVFHLGEWDGQKLGPNINFKLDKID